MKKALKITMMATLLLIIAVGCKKEVVTPEEPEVVKIYEVTDFHTVDISQYTNLMGQFGNFINLDSISTDSVPHYISPNQLMPMLMQHYGNGVSSGKLKYLSKDVEGNETWLSGRIYIKNTDDKNLKGIIIANHATIGSNGQCPSESIPQIDGILSIFGYAVVMADYIGFGSTVDMNHPYLHWSSTARASIDAYFALVDYLADEGYVVGNELYNVGYSQGGEAAMAVLRMATENYSDKIHFTRSLMGGGPYSIESTYDDVIESDYTGIPYAIPMIFNGLNSAHNLGLNLDDLFIGEMHEGYKTVLSKQYTTIQMMFLFNEHQVSKILQPFLFDKTDPTTAKIIGAARQNELIGTWMPKSGENIYLFHSEDDDMVPFVNSEEMSEVLEDAGCELETVFGPYGTHITGAAIYYMSLAGYFNEK